jgi:hypothetical protein
MAEYRIPTEERRFSQLNQGDVFGNVRASFGVDFSMNKGRVALSTPTDNVFDEDDENTFGPEPVNAFAFYDGFYWCVSNNNVHKSGAQNPISGWAADTAVGSPDTGGQRSDMVVFDGLLLVSSATSDDETIYSWNGSVWANWWETTLGQSAFAGNSFIPMEVGPQGDLFILEDEDQVYRVDTAGSVTAPGSNGALDFSADTVGLICMASSSTRLWLGGYDTNIERGVIVEWDMSENSTKPNRIHKVAAAGVRCIAIHNDSPIAVLSNGNILLFNGVAFEEADFRFPRARRGTKYLNDVRASSGAAADTLIHPNGWAIIDGLPHFLVGGSMYDATNNTNIKATKNGDWEFPGGVWCLDPDIGLYHRFPMEREIGTTGVGTAAIGKVGALFSAVTDTSRFIAGANVYSDSSGTEKSVMFADDKDRTSQTRGWFATQPVPSPTAKSTWNKIGVGHSVFENSANSIVLSVKQKNHANLPFVADVTWQSTTQFTSTDADFASVEAGHRIQCILGEGAGSTAFVTDNNESGGTYTVDLDDTIVGVAATDTGSVRVDNFIKVGVADNTVLDYDEFDIPSTDRSNKLTLNIEMRGAAGSDMEIDQVALISEEQ